MDVEKRGLAKAVLQLVRMDVDHQGDPIRPAVFFWHHIEHKPITGVFEILAVDPAGWLAFTGRELNPLDRDEGFQITSSSLPGLFLAQRPKTCTQTDSIGI